jgi:type I restriction enzyme S subunit
MVKYNEYKDSGIEWLGNIPLHWDLKKLKYLLKKPLKYGANEPAIEENHNDPRYLRITDFDDNENLRNNTFKSLPYIIAKDYFLEEGDLLFARSGATVGKTFLFKNYSGRACFAGYLIKATSNKKILKSEYLSFYTKSYSYDFWKDSIFIQATIQNISAEKYNSLSIPIPPLKEQTQIVNYLYAKTTSIDKKIKLLKQKIKHYKAYRKTLINETVTKGLDKSVKLKDSGIDWIGEIPEHWEIKRLKDVSKIFTGNSISDKSMYETKKDSFDYIATKDINIHNKKVNYDNGIYIPKKDKSFKITKKDTSLICLEGASAGNKLTFVDREVAFVNKLCAIKSTDKNVFDKYIFFQLQSNLFRSQFFELLSGLIGGVSLGLLKYFNVVIPSINEQQQIADFLDAKTNTIDNIVNNIETQITTLKELRKTLINEVVTGKVKVTA